MDSTQQSRTYGNKTYINVKQNPIDNEIREQAAPLSKIQSLRKKFLTGWRFAVIASAIISIVVLVLNIVFLTVVALGPGFEDGQGIVYEGSCSTIRPISVLVHLVINALSTILLAASNYTMQVLSAPSRQDINKAHARSVWLDIGVSSTRNLVYINKLKVMMWLLLIISSLPLHLFYNSALYSTTTANDYIIISAGNSFAQNATIDSSLFNSSDISPRYAHFVRLIQVEAVQGRLERMENAACITAYAQVYQESRGNLVLVIDSQNNPRNKSFITYKSIRPPDNGELKTRQGSPDTFGWICGGNNYTNPCLNAKLQDVINNATNWSPFGQLVDYCLSQLLPQHCKLQMSQHLMLTVIGANLLKAIVMAITVFSVKQVPLLTIGDAIASFIESSDSKTEGMCLVAKSDFINRHRNLQPKQWMPKHDKWFHALSLRRRVICITLYLVAICACSFLLIYGVQQAGTDFGAQLKLGLGAIDTTTLIRYWLIPSAGTRGLIGNVLVANLAQLILSFIYFSYNGLFTSMWQAKEWSQYAANRKPLRVSDTPQGVQRSTYFLQLPYRYALPLMVFSGTLHWLVSQSIFIVIIEEYILPGNFDTGPTGIVPTFLRDTVAPTITCGYSPLAILLVIVLGVAMIAFGLAMAMKRLPIGSPPLAGSCSMAISAACHLAGSRERGQSLKPLQWGVISSGHCGFSSDTVSQPMEGEHYAGRCI